MSAILDIKSGNAVFVCLSTTINNSTISSDIIDTLGYYSGVMIFAYSSNADISFKFYYSDLVTMSGRTEVPSKYLTRDLSVLTKTAADAQGDILQAVAAVIDKRYLQIDVTNSVAQDTIITILAMMGANEQPVENEVQTILLAGLAEEDVDYVLATNTTPEYGLLM